jgi:hypothetical protein
VVHDCVVSSPIPNDLYLNQGGDAQVCTCGDRDVEQEVDEGDEKPKLNSEEVLKSLSLMHPPEQWAFFEEIRVGTGFTKDSDQRLDAWAICYLPSKRNVVRGFEVKVSRSDYFSEIKKPRKRRVGLRLSNEFYFVTPKNLIKVEELPPECGLIEVSGNGTVSLRVSAPYRDCAPSWLFMASVFRRMDKGRLEWWNKASDHDSDLTVGYGIIQNILKDHIASWSAYRDGSREVPNQIADALKKVYYDFEGGIKGWLKLKGKKL